MKINMKKLFKKMFAVLSISTVVVVSTIQINNFSRAQKMVLINYENKNELSSLNEKMGSNPSNRNTDNSTGNDNSTEKKADLIKVKVVLNYSPPAPENDINKDAEHFESMNKHYLDVILPHLKGVVNSSHNKLVPIVWIDFEENTNMLENFNYLNNQDFVFSATEVENISLVERKATNKPWLNESFNDNTLHDQHGLINFSKQKDRENKLINSNDLDWFNKNKTQGAIGILEAGFSIADKNHEVFKDRIVEVYNNGLRQKVDDHSTLVAAIAAGKSGVDRFAKIYSAGFNNFGQEWHDRVEWMVLKGVKVINHSYGSSNNWNKVDYDNDSFFIDYLSRKYGVINIFAAGNGNADPNKLEEWIDGTQLSHNSVTVAAVDNYADFSPTPYSNRLRFAKYLDLPKPLIAAPGDYFFLKGVYNTRYVIGTSFAAPLVSGALSALMRTKNIFNDKNRVSALKAILAASARKSEASYFENEIGRNGLNSSVGAGLLDFEKMLEAADNLQTLNIPFSQKDEVYKSDIIDLKSGEEIQLASAWLFNAGLQKNNSGNTYNFTNLYNKKEEAFAHQNYLFFSDYDLILEKKTYGAGYIEVNKITVTASNVELIKHTATEPGEYRIRVVKVSDATYKDSLDDQLSITYVKN